MTESETADGSLTSLFSLLVLAVVFSAVADAAVISDGLDSAGATAVCFFGEEVNLRLFEAALLGLLAVLLILLLPCFLGDSLASALLCLPSTIAGLTSRPSLSLGVTTADAAPPTKDVTISNSLARRGQLSSVSCFEFSPIWILATQALLLYLTFSVERSQQSYQRNIIEWPW